jgi:parvulin-like peptidyl-prolyl isomerase
MGLTVNGVAIADGKIAEEIARLKTRYEAYVRENGGEPSEAELREWAEEDLIEEELFRQEAAARFPEPSDERALQYIAESPEAFETVPESEKLPRSKEALRARALMKDVRKGVSRPSENVVRKYYDDQPEIFRMPESLRLSHICRLVQRGGMGKSDLFLDLLRLKADIGSFQINWMEAVETCSDTFGQDYGVFEPVSAGDLAPAIEAKLFALKPGEVSDVVELDGGSLHLFRLLAKEPERLMAFKEVKETIAKMLFEQACQSALEEKFDALKARAVIQRGA